MLLLLICQQTMTTTMTTVVAALLWSLLPLLLTVAASTTSAALTQQQPYDCPKECICLSSTQVRHTWCSFFLYSSSSFVFTPTKTGHLLPSLISSVCWRVCCFYMYIYLLLSDEALLDAHDTIRRARDYGLLFFFFNWLYSPLSFCLL
jgi:hypothetical protein